MSDTDAPRERPVATPSQTVGPFFHFGLTTNAGLGVVAPPAAGTPMRLRVTVLDGEGAPVPDAMIELYQADAQGVYARAPFTGFGRLPTGEDGSCVFETIRPGAVADGRGGLQAPHVNVCLFARGLLRHLYTRIYFAGDALEGDPILALVPEERRQTLVASPGDDGAFAIAVRLQGEQETVFFDV
jgi:protocatechuate 3,4-dioxygenase, alpha subunit